MDVGVEDMTYIPVVLCVFAVVAASGYLWRLFGQQQRSAQLRAELFRDINNESKKPKKIVAAPKKREVPTEVAPAAVTGQLKRPAAQDRPANVTTAVKQPKLEAKAEPAKVEENIKVETIAGGVERTNVPKRSKISFSEDSLEVGSATTADSKKPEKAQVKETKAVEKADSKPEKTSKVEKSKTIETVSPPLPKAATVKKTKQESDDQLPQQFLSILDTLAEEQLRAALERTLARIENPSDWEHVQKVKDESSPAVLQSKLKAAQDESLDLRNQLSILRTYNEGLKTQKDRSERLFRVQETTLQEKHAKLETETAALRDRVAGLKKSLAEEQAKTSLLEQKPADHEALNVLQEQLRSTQAALVTAEAALATLSNEQSQAIALHAKQIEAFEERVRSLQAEADLVPALRASLSSAQSQAQQAQQQVEAQQLEIQQLKNASATVIVDSERTKAIQSALEQAQHELSQLRSAALSAADQTVPRAALLSAQDKLLEVQSELQTVRNQLSQVESQQAHRQLAEAQAESALADSQKQIQSLKAKVAELEQSLSVSLSSANEVAERLARAETELRELQQAYHQLLIQSEEANKTTAVSSVHAAEIEQLKTNYAHLVEEKRVLEQRLHEKATSSSSSSEPTSSPAAATTTTTTSVPHELEQAYQLLQQQLYDTAEERYHLQQSVESLQAHQNATKPHKKNGVNGKQNGVVNGDTQEQDIDEEAEKSKAHHILLAKKANGGKSSVLLDVKPLNENTDIQALDEELRAIQIDGLLWGKSQIVPVISSINKLQVTCVVEDDKVPIQLLKERVASLENVQSVDVVAQNKI